MMKKLRPILFLAFCVFFTVGTSKNLPHSPSGLTNKLFHEWVKTEKVFKSEINLISYNTWGLPISLEGHDQGYRFNLLGKIISDSGGDIVCLQETFHPDLRQKIYNSVHNTYTIFHDCNCNKSILPWVKMDCYGGLMTLSKYPILFEKFYKYPTTEHSSIIEKIGSKGFLVSHIQYGQKIVRIVNTHLYAGNNSKAEQARLTQIKYMYAILESLSVEGISGTILMGDFNIHPPSVAHSEAYDFIIETMNFFDSKPNLSPNDFTMDCEANKYVNCKEKKTKLDYIFYKNHDKNITKILDQSRVFEKNKTLSDHFGWQVKVKI